MSPPIRRFAPIAAATLAIALAAATAFLAMAQDGPRPGRRIAQRPQPTSAGKVILGRERRGDEKNDERYGHQADRRR